MLQMKVYAVKSYETVYKLKKAHSKSKPRTTYLIVRGDLRATITLFFYKNNFIRRKALILAKKEIKNKPRTKLGLLSHRT